MAWAKGRFRRLVGVMLCVGLLVWSAAPAFTHAPALLDTIQEHLEMVEAHGHSHGFDIDLSWALHGHSHDVADHDHSRALPVMERRADLGGPPGKTQPAIGWVRSPTRQARIDRPPRV